MVEDETILKEIGAAIKNRREELGMSQEKLAEKSGIDRSFICGVERGVNNASILTISEITKALGKNFIDFICSIKNKSCTKH